MVSSFHGDRTIIRVGDQDILILNRNSEGISISIAKLYREDGKFIGEIKDNKWVSNPKMYFEPVPSDPYQFTIIDKDFKTILKVRFINENSITVEGRFYFPNADLIQIAHDKLLFGTNSIGNNCFEESPVCVMIAPNSS